MRTLSQISVPVPQGKFDLFLAKLSSLTASRWRRDPAGEESANQVLTSIMGQYIYFVPLSGAEYDVVFHYLNGLFKLVTILPPKGQTSYAEHCRLADGIWYDGMAQACRDLGLDGVLVPGRRVKPESGLPDGVARALNDFASYVNKSTGTVDSRDMEVWCRFLVLLHKSGAKMSEERLDAFLEEKKFPEEIKMELLLQFEMASVLLPMYDESLASSKPATVQ